MCIPNCVSGTCSANAKGLNILPLCNPSSHSLLGFVNCNPKFLSINNSPPGLIRYFATLSVSINGAVISPIAPSTGSKEGKNPGDDGLSLPRCIPR